MYNNNNNNFYRLLNDWVETCCFLLQVIIVNSEATQVQSHWLCYCWKRNKKWKCNCACERVFSPNPPWSEMGGGPERHQVLSSNAILFYPLRLLYIGSISSYHLLPCLAISAWAFLFFSSPVLSSLPPF